MIPILSDTQEFVEITCRKEDIHSDNLTLAIKMEGKKYFENKNKQIYDMYNIKSESNIENLEHTRELFLINKMCPICTKDNILHSFEYTSHYELRQQYLDDFCLKIYCPDCLFLEEFEHINMNCRITDYHINDIKNELWSQYVDLWKFWDFELLCGSTCPVCDTFIYCNHKDKSAHTNQYICTNSDCNFYEYYSKD